MFFELTGGAFNNEVIWGEDPKGICQHSKEGKWHQPDLPSLWKKRRKYHSPVHLIWRVNCLNLCGICSFLIWRFYSLLTGLTGKLWTTSVGWSFSSLLMSLCKPPLLCGPYGYIWTILWLTISLLNFSLSSFIEKSLRWLDMANDPNPYLSLLLSL